VQRLLRRLVVAGVLLEDTFRQDNQYGGVVSCLRVAEPGAARLAAGALRVTLPFLAKARAAARFRMHAPGPEQRSHPACRNAGMRGLSVEVYFNTVAGPYVPSHGLLTDTTRFQSSPFPPSRAQASAGRTMATARGRREVATAPHSALSAMAGARSVGDAPAPRRQAGPAPETPAAPAAPGSRKRARAPRAKKAAAAEAAAAADEDGIEDEDNVIVLADDSQDLVAPARARPAALLACGHRGQHPGAALGHLCV